MKQLGQTKESKSALTMGLMIAMTKSVKTLRITRLRRRILRPGAGVGQPIKKPFARFRKSCFCKDLQVRNACIFASFRKYAFAEILRFANMIFACFRKLSRKFANIVLQCFTSFRMLLQFMVSQAFARIRKESQMDFRKDSLVRKS